jgi:transposase
MSLLPPEEYSLVAASLMPSFSRLCRPRKKHRRDRLIELAERYDWVVGYLDEVWWSRFALPNMRVWQHKGQPVHLQQRTARAKAQDPDPKALACYGLWCDRARRGGRGKQMLLRFVSGRPVSHVTRAFLEWACGELAKAGEKVLVLIWDNASWHVSEEVREWIAAHNREAKESGEGKGIRIIVVGLPTKSPWLNKIEPKWGHGKKAIVEAEGELSAEEVEERVCAYFKTSMQPHLVQVKVKVKVKVKKEQGQKRAAGGEPGKGSKSGRPAQEAKTQQAA